MSQTSRRALLASFTGAACGTGLTLLRADSPRGRPRPAPSVDAVGWIRNVLGRILYIGDDEKECGRAGATETPGQPTRPVRWRVARQWKQRSAPADHAHSRNRTPSGPTDRIFADHRTQDWLRES